MAHPRISASSLANASAKHMKNSNPLETPTFSIESVTQLNSETAKVEGYFLTHPTSKDGAMTSVARTFNGRISAIAGTVHVDEVKGRGMFLNQRMHVSMLVATTRESIALEGSEGRMVQHAANLYMDSTDESFWELNNGNLTRANTEDLSELVALANVNAPIKTHSEPVKICEIAAINAKSVPYVQFYNAKTGKMDNGFVVHSNTIVSTNSDELVLSVDQDMVQVCATVDLTQFVEANLDIDASDSQALKDNYLAIAHANPEFFIELCNTLAEQAYA